MIVVADGIARAHAGPPATSETPQDPVIVESVKFMGACPIAPAGIPSPSHSFRGKPSWAFVGWNHCR